MTKQTDTTPQAGNLVRVKKPGMISMVGKPANQTSFKILRSDATEDETENKEKSEMNKPPSGRRVRRSDAQNPVLRLTFPEGYTTDKIASTLADYGMSGYTIGKDNGLIIATRSDLQSIANDQTQQINLGDGVMATVSRGAENPVAASTNERAGVLVTALEFDQALHDLATAGEWLSRNNIDISGLGQENPDSSILVSRAQVSEETEVRRLDLGDGVTAVLVQADVNDIPDSLVQVISDSAYGNWGWGFVDFNSAMADLEFCEAMDTSVYRLKEVLWNILFYSSIPIDVRKTLVVNALTQYAAYVTGIMDSLPRQVLASVARSANSQEKNMGSKENGGNAPAKDEQVTVSRSELEKMIADGVTAALKRSGEQNEGKENPPETKPEGHETNEDGTPKTNPGAPVQTGVQPPVQQSGTKPNEAPKQDGSNGDEVEEGNKPVTRSEMESNIVAAVTAAMTPIIERLAPLEGKTVLRSDTGDAQTQEAQKPKKQVIVRADGTKDYSEVFRGAIPGLRRGS